MLLCEIYNLICDIKARLQKLIVKFVESHARNRRYDITNSVQTVCNY